MSRLEHSVSDRGSPQEAAASSRSSYEISKEFIDEVRESTLPREIVRLLERRAARSDGLGRAAGSTAA